MIPVTVVVLNANTSEPMTKALGDRARKVARPGTEIVSTHPSRGPGAVEGWLDAYRSAAGMVEHMAVWKGPMDALVIAGFGDVGRDALRELLDVPVVDITEAAVITAQLVAHRYGVVTTVGRAKPLIEASLAAAGQLGRCASIQALDIGVADVASGWPVVQQCFRRLAATVVAEGAEAICLGSAALSPFRDQLAREIDVPVIDGLAAGVAWCESCVHMGLRTSAVGAWSSKSQTHR